MGSSCPNVNIPLCVTQSSPHSVHKRIGNTCKNRYDVLCENASMNVGTGGPLGMYNNTTNVNSGSVPMAVTFSAPTVTRVDPTSVTHDPSLVREMDERCNGPWYEVPVVTPTGRRKFKPQSGVETYADGTTSDNAIMKIDGNGKYENMAFSDQVDPYRYDVGSFIDSTRRLQDMGDASLQNFFSRPIKIAEEGWATNTTLSFDINPWSLYFDNPRVTNRLSNFNLMRAKLHVKIVINGNGFQYGRALVSYLPFDIFDTLSTNAALIREDLVQASQQPHLFLDPTTSQGGEMILPFYNYWNYSSIPDSQWSELGTLFFRSLNDLKHSNDAADIVTISVFAWAEDVEMSVLTSVDTDTIVPQSGKEVDEVNAKGVISGPATSIAKVAGAMTKVPYIGPFAQATEMVSKTTASVAKMFGYCRPPVTKNPEPYKPYPASALAMTNTGDGPTKMTIDDKQELTIDPRISGLSGIDTMNIKEIAKRESYLTTFDWRVGTAPETLLWNARVDPCTWAENAGAVTSYHFPACAMAAMPFKYWTGSMRFRFQIVCSAFHKGRLKIVYDPNFFSSNEYNTNYLNVIDIADKTDFTIEIANGQNRTLLDRALPGTTPVTAMYSTTPYTSNATFGNGVVGVYVVNELTTPNSTVDNDIQVNVFVSMGEDFEVFVPDDYFQYFTFKPFVDGPGEGPGVTAQSGMEMQGGTIVSESQNTEEPSAPQQQNAMTLGPTMSDNSDINKVFTGESIASFRTLLKRYNLWTALPLANPDARSLYGRFSMFPYLRGAVSGAVDTTFGGADYNYCNTVLLHWVTMAHSGWRGSIRYKWLPRGTLSTDWRPSLNIQRHPIGEFAFSRVDSVPPAYFEPRFAGAGVMPTYNPGGSPSLNKPFTGTRGQVYQSGFLNPAIEFEVPYYSPFRFSPGKEESHTGISLFNEGYDYFLEAGGDISTCWDIHVAAGEDFQTYFFTGLPRMYFEPTIPL